ncbi:MAG: vitamin K epoxide reductase family protein [Deltaproteobacteria bacterium]
MADDKLPSPQKDDPPKKEMPFKFITVLAILGMLVSAYLTWIHWNPGVAACTGVGDCEAVNSSAYATLGEIPIAILGFGMYASVLGLVWIGKRAGGRASDNAGLGIFGFSLLGVLFSGYLTYIELYVIHAICPYCVISAILVTLIFAVSVPNFLAWMRV